MGLHMTMCGPIFIYRVRVYPVLVSYLNAASPVTSMPVISRWMSCVPS